MKIILLFFIITFFSVSCFSQVSDFMVLKKDQRTIKSFFVGSNISFETAGGYYSGQINAIKKDSVFLTEFDIRQVPTNMGIMVTDTLASYHLVFSYKEISKIERQKHKGFNWQASGGSLLGGGVLIAAVGLGTWIFTRPGTQYYASPYLVGGAALLAGGGYLLLTSNGNYFTIGNKYRLEYIGVK